jgi:hypothetical protein
MPGIEIDIDPIFGVIMAKPKRQTVHPETGETVVAESLTVKPIVSGFVITCPKCKKSQQERVSQFAPNIEIGPYKCPACEFETVFNPPIKVGGVKRRYLKG